jgi:hypothetical protein
MRRPAPLKRVPVRAWDASPARGVQTAIAAAAEFARLAAGGGKIRTIGPARRDQGFKTSSCRLCLISRQRKYGAHESRKTRTPGALRRTDGSNPVPFQQRVRCEPDFRGRSPLLHLVSGFWRRILVRAARHGVRWPPDPVRGVRRPPHLRQQPRVSLGTACRSVTHDRTVAHPC